MESDLGGHVSAGTCSICNITYVFVECWIVSQGFGVSFLFKPRDYFVIVVVVAAVDFFSKTKIGILRSFVVESDNYTDT